MNHEQLLARRALRASRVLEKPWIQHGCGADSGAGHRGEQRLGFGSEWGALESAALREPERACSRLFQNGNLPSKLYLLSELPQLAKGYACLSLPRSRSVGRFQHDRHA